MKSAIIAAGCIALAQLFTLSARAAADIPDGNPVPESRPKATKEERQAGHAQRKAAGAAAAREQQSSEGNPVPAPATKVAKEQRVAARAARKAETARAVKAGELPPRGETNGQ